MRSALCGALLCGLAVHAAAQGTAVTFQEVQPVTVTGFAVGSAQYDRSQRSNTLTAGKLAVSLFKPAGDAYFFGQLTTALADGRFDAPIGFERDDEPLNLVPTNSFNFEFARPAKLTGAVVRFTASPRVELTAAAADGWNVDVDNNRGKTALLRAQWLPVGGLTIGVSGLYGPEQDGTDGQQRSLLAPDVTLDLGRLIVGTELNLGRERDAGGNLTWGGAAATAFLRLGHRIGLAARYDHLSDTGGALTGTRQVLRSVTVGPMWFYSQAQEGIFSNIEHTTFHLPQIALRAALRVDYSTQPFFETTSAGQERTDTRAVVEFLYLF